MVPRNAFTIEAWESYDSYPNNCDESKALMKKARI
jgi:hypothetical protein